MVCLDLIAQGPGDAVDAKRVVQNYPHGQLLVAGWGSIAPALGVRELQTEHSLYLETFLAAVYPVSAGGQETGRAVVIVPLADVALPTRSPARSTTWSGPYPPHSIVLAESELPTGSRRGDTKTYAEVMAIWERLHLPFLAAADMQADPVLRMEGYRKAIRVDYACELAHQKLADAAREMMRGKR